LIIIIIKYPDKIILIPLDRSSSSNGLKLSANELVILVRLVQVLLSFYITAKELVIEAHWVVG